MAVDLKLLVARKTASVQSSQMTPDRQIHEPAISVPTATDNSDRADKEIDRRLHELRFQLFQAVKELSEKDKTIDALKSELGRNSGFEHLSPFKEVHEDVEEIDA
uniref:Uncharacterized protein LOC102808146 n=1 Tax=Saccoglossus kowalevskii TaxID=10224 RepID=A0ABM0MGF8_SACKO|nr:PREDICTED: uncharacterized protein LOC102808146 [Saccoglossus kowalevskii]